MHSEAKVVTSWWPGSKERWEGTMDPNISFNGMTQISSLPPTRSHLLNVPPPPVMPQAVDTCDPNYSS
jgi:hypothetical protein